MKKNQKEELELLSYQDIAELILKEKKNGKTTMELFVDICKKLDLSKNEVKDKIGDFYTALTFDKRFLILKDGKWDLRSNHLINIAIEDDDDEDIEENFEQEEVETDEINDDIDENSDDDDEDDGLEELVIIENEDLNEN